VISFYLHGLGITIGYHRLLAHRSFRCPKFVEYFLVMSGYLAWEGSPAWWTSVHRAHHVHSDQSNDPHSPKAGLAHSYFSWMGRQDSEIINPQCNSKDILADPVYRLLERGDDPLLLAINIGVRLVLWYCFGWQVALANLLGSLAALQIPLMLNVICHLPKLGYRNYNTDDRSTNVLWMGWLAAGEGWHNNHHAFPGSARQGFRWFEFDLSFLVISALKFVGLATQINTPSRALLRKRMENKRLLAVALDAPEPARKS
jgi:stearoyl-CoA desaturase (delta-9 desaturase)